MSDAEPTPKAPPHLDSVPQDADVVRGAYLRFASAVGLWTLGAALISAVAILRSLQGDPTSLGDQAPVGARLVQGAAAAGLAALGVFLLGVLGLWRARIEAIESRRVRWRQEDRYKLVRIALVLLFGFLAGTWVWTLDAAVAVVAVACGFAFAVGAVWRAWGDMPAGARRIAISGGVLAALHPLSLLIAGAFGQVLTTAGFAALAVSVALAWRNLRPVEENEETESSPAVAV